MLADAGLGLAVDPDGRHTFSRRAASGRTGGYSPIGVTVAMADSAQVQDLLRQVLTAAQQGRLDVAEAAGRKALAAAPDHPDALQLMGLVLLERGDREEAEPLFRRSLAIRPRQPNVWNNLGNLLADRGALDDAAGCYRKAVALAPGYVDAWLNLADVQDTLGDRAGALAAVDRARSIDPGNAKALGIRGRLLKDAGQLDAALASLTRAVAARPSYFEAAHNAGLVLRMLGRPAEAIPYYEHALSLRATAPEVSYNLANALHDLGLVDRAVAGYRAAIALRPDYVAAHETLAKVLWEQGRHDDHLSSFPPALEQAPACTGLAALYGRLLLRRGDKEQAAHVLRQAMDRAGADPELQDVLAKVETERGNTEAAKALFEAAIDQAPQSAAYRRDYARLLIRLGDYRPAADHLEAVRRSDPFDQEVIAYLGLCWRFLDEGREAWLNDYQRFVRPLMIPVPDGYADTAAFNTALNNALTPLHRSKTHPIDQTLRGGTQTSGTLFAEAVPEVQQLKAMLETAIARYIRELPDDADHPLLGRKTGAFRFSGSWSVRLRGQGFHVNHVHSRGWLSSAYYVALPDGVGDDPTREGWIKFGESNLGLQDRERTARYVRPVEGMLVLFPSYMFHGTVPFHGEQTRTTVAFDVVPDPA